MGLFQKFTFSVFFKNRNENFLEKTETVFFSDDLCKKEVERKSKSDIIELAVKYSKYL